MKLSGLSFWALPVMIDLHANAAGWHLVRLRLRTGPAFGLGTTDGALAVLLL
jgi:hypothetical protein